MKNTHEALKSLIADMAGSLSKEGVTASWVEKEKQERVRKSEPKSKIQEKWTGKEWTAEMFASIRAKDLSRLEISLAAGADVKAQSGPEHSRESALMAAVKKKWAPGIARLAAAGAPVLAANPKGACGLLWFCAAHDFVEGARILWDLHGAEDQKAAVEKFCSFEGFEFVCSKGMESSFDSYTLQMIGGGELSKKPLSALNLDRLGKIFKSSALMDYAKGDLWQSLIELDDPKLLDHAGRSGWAPRPDGSCVIAVRKNDGKYIMKEKSFCELIVAGSWRGEWRLGKEMLSSSTFREALEKDAAAMETLAEWVGHDARLLKDLAKAGLALEKLLGDEKRNALHFLLEDRRHLFKGDEFVGEQELKALLKLCPEWASQKDADDLTPFGLFVQGHPGREAEVSKIESMMLSAEVKAKRGKKPKAKRL